MSLLSNSDRRTESQVTACKWRSTKHFPIALRVFHLYFEKIMEAENLPHHIDALLSQDLASCECLLTEYLMYTYQWHLAEITLNTVYAAISKPQAPIPLTQSIINQIKHLFTTPTKFVEKKYFAIGSNYHTNNFNNQRRRNNSQKFTPNKNSNSKQKFIDPKHCRYCKAGNCWNQYHQFIKKNYQ